ncbi:MAG: histidine kinase N-terminal 7TM domain-containing protein, partial [bacterium]
MADFRIIILGIVAVVDLLFAITVLLKSKKREARAFGFFAIGLAAWTFGLFMFYRSLDPISSLFWAKSLYFAGNIIAVFFLYFSFAFPQQEKSLARWQKSLVFLPIAIHFYLYYFTDIIIANSFIDQGVKGFIYGSFRWAFDIPFMIYFLWAFINLFVKYKKSTGTTRFQLRYVVLSVLIALAIAATTNVILLWFGIFNYVWIGPEATLMIVAASTYAIIRYRLMDIRLVMRQSTVWLVSLALAGGAGFAVLYLDPSLTILSLLLSMILFALIKYGMEILANKFFFLSWYDYQKTLREVARKLTSIIDLEKLSNLIIETIAKTMQIDKAALLLRDKNKYLAQKLMGFKQENGLSLVRDNQLTEYLEKTGKLVVYEELSLVGLDHLKNNMKEMRAQLCLPLALRNKLLGIIVLGPKISGDAYTKQDIDLLETLASQGSIAIENAQFYNSMEEKVQDQVKDIQELMNVKSEFLNLASHQLRTPTSGIRAALSMITEGSTTPAQTKEFIQDCYVNVNRLVIIIKDILDAQSIAGRGLKLSKSSVQIEDIISESMTMFKVLADQKGLYLNFEKPKEK